VVSPKINFRETETSLIVEIPKAIFENQEQVFKKLLLIEKDHADKFKLSILDEDHFETIQQARSLMDRYEETLGKLSQ
jgi:hypothetical protein